MNDNSDNRFEELDKRLKAAEESASGKPKNSSQTPEESAESRRSVGIAFRMGTEFVAGVVVGVVFGLLIDNYFGTSPWGFIVLFILGSMAGFANVYRAVNNMGYSVGYKKPTPPSELAQTDEQDKKDTV